MGGKVGQPASISYERVESRFPLRPTVVWCTPATPVSTTTYHESHETPSPTYFRGACLAAEDRPPLAANLRRVAFAQTFFPLVAS